MYLETLKKKRTDLARQLDLFRLFEPPRLRRVATTVERAERAYWRAKVRAVQARLDLLQHQIDQHHEGE